MTLAIGRPDLIPQSPVRVSGFKKAIDEMEWVVERIQHSMGNGFTTSVELYVLVSTSSDTFPV